MENSLLKMIYWHVRRDSTLSHYIKKEFFLSVKGRAKTDIIASNQFKYLKNKSNSVVQHLIGNH